MTTPITPPPELVEKWWDLIPGFSTGWKRQLCTQAAQWGADQRGAVNEAELQKARDQELEACKQYMHDQDWFMSPTLRMAQLHNARRPKPLSLKEEALAELDEIMTELHNETGSAFTASNIRRAIEALPND